MWDSFESFAGQSNFSQFFSVEEAVVVLHVYSSTFGSPAFRRSVLNHAHNFPKMLSSYCYLSGVLLTWTILITLPQVCVATSPLCYDMDGTVMAGDRPCSADSQVSQCCGLYWTCLENGMCASANTSALTGQDADTLMRATCTDETWNSDICPHFCLQPGNSTCNKKLKLKAVVPNRNIAYQY